MNDPEMVLWGALRGRQLDGYRFRRQHPIEDCIVDFVCLEASLVVEVDGESHDEQLAYDRKRTQWLATQGFRVIRVSNADVLTNLDGVAEFILSHLVRCKPGD